MRRADTTTADQQIAYRGRHLPGDGRDGYGKTARRYLRCSCGWRIVGITFRQRQAARIEYDAHLAEHGRR